MSRKRSYKEIIYNLQWKTKTINTAYKSNIVAIYDIPATTLNWETFKSYLLKDTNTIGDDVNVSFINLDKQEIAINSQIDFQIALYSIREQARLGDIITLILEPVSDENKGAKPKNCKYSNQTQLDVNEIEFDQPPKWFFNYMKTVGVVCYNVRSRIKFKKEVVEDVTDNLTRQTKTNLHPNMQLLQKSIRNIPDLSIDLNTEPKKTLELDSNEDISLMNAKPINQTNAGKIYRHCWEVINNGKLPWTEQTELWYTGGSQELVPVKKNVTCPKLKPGEKGLVSVFIKVPETPGSYECYWHFHHKGCRFGHWLGCHIIIDDSPIKNQMYDIIIGESSPCTSSSKKEEKRSKNYKFPKGTEKSSSITTIYGSDNHSNVSVADNNSVPVKTENSTPSKTASCDPIEEKDNPYPKLEPAEMSNSIKNDINRPVYVFPQFGPGFQTTLFDLRNNEFWKKHTGFHFGLKKEQFWWF